MARFNVQMTLQAPGLRAPLRATHRLPGSAASLRLIGSEGSIAVTASRVAADSPADAAMIVLAAVRSRWLKKLGPLVMRSWTAHRERVLFGSRRGSSSGWIGTWDGDDDGPDEGGTAGVREPRRPLPGPGSLHAERELPGGRPDHPTGSSRLTRYGPGSR
jgi:hypothetical protein